MNFGITYGVDDLNVILQDLLPILWRQLEMERTIFCGLSPFFGQSATQTNLQPLIFPDFSYGMNGMTISGASSHHRIVRRHSAPVAPVALAVRSVTCWQPHVASALREPVAVTVMDQHLATLVAPLVAPRKWGCP